MGRGAFCIVEPVLPPIHGPFCAVIRRVVVVYSYDFITFSVRQRITTAEQ